MADRKTEGQYMTPDKIVSIILDNIGYEKNNIFKKIMEPSFGDGAFLCEIIKRIINEGKNNDLSADAVADIIKNSVFGIEKDKAMYDKAIGRLNDIMSQNNIPPVDLTHNLLCGDALILYDRFNGKMDYVVGNPPYVRIHNIPESYRNIIKNFRFSDGMLDLYIVFYEIGIMMLNDTGKLGYISPNSFLKNASQKNFRKFLVDNKYPSAIYDFKNSKIFEDADTYTCICILDKDSLRKDLSVDYKEYAIYQIVAENRFEYDYFKTCLYDKPWVLTSKKDMEFLEKIKARKIKIENIAAVQNGVSTNSDQIYVIHAFCDNKLSVPYKGKHTDKNIHVFFKDKNSRVQQIESKILRRCVKESRYDGIMDNIYIIFPYEIDNKKTAACGYKPLTEDKLKEKYPKAYGYLSLFKKELESRDMDKNAAWFLFARSQGVRNSCHKKIVFKHVINKQAPKVIPYILDEDVIVYSGMYTTIKNETENSLEDICEIFKSDDFARYCALMGKDMSGDYSSISTKIVKHYGVS